MCKEAHNCTTTNDHGIFSRNRNCVKMISIIQGKEFVGWVQ
jgi:hypothetical protein